LDQAPPFLVEPEDVVDGSHHVRIGTLGKQFLDRARLESNLLEVEHLRVFDLQLL
jgi:hypothetical protein